VNDTFVEFGIIGTAIAVPLALALIARRRLATRRTLGAWLVVGAVALGSAAAFWLLQRRADRLQDERMNRAIDDMVAEACKKPVPPGNRMARAVHDFQCSDDLRSARMQPGPAAPGVRSFDVSLHGGDAMVSIQGERTPPAGKVYRLWFRDARGGILDSADLDPAQSLVFILDRPAIGATATLMVTVDAPAAATPSTAVVAQGAI
jgi:hypothetical protein